MDTALFSPSSLFSDISDNSSDEESNTHDNFVERTHQFPRMELLLREFSFHQLNANLLWPGTFSFAEWLVQHQSWVEGRCIIELGSGTRALAIFLKKLLQLDITTSDYDDKEIEENIAYNSRINGILPALPHVRHTWGDTFPSSIPNWDLVIASDILLYVKQYPNLIKTLSFLLKAYQPRENIKMSLQQDKDGIFLSDSCSSSLFICLFGISKVPLYKIRWPGLPSPAFLMSWRRRIGKDDESLFFKGCDDAGLEVQHLGSRVYCITSRERA